MLLLPEFNDIGDEIRQLGGYSDISEYVNRGWGGRLSRENAWDVVNSIGSDIEGKWTLLSLDNKILDFLNKAKDVLDGKLDNVNETDVSAFVATVIVDDINPS